MIEDQFFKKVKDCIIIVKSVYNNFIIYRHQKTQNIQNLWRNPNIIGETNHPKY